ncbi:MAG TPA: hypothetical protein VF463_10680 [Sphingobium sp.]
MAPKRRPSFTADQLIFTFDAPAPARAESSLAGMQKMVAAAVGRILHEDERNRHQIAARMSELLDETVSKSMLDGYSSEAREEFSISFHRLLALIAATDRHDVLDALIRPIGGAVLVGEEIHTAQLGHLDRQIAELRARRKHIEGSARPIGRGK